MALTTAQNALIKSAILADPQMSTAIAGDDGAYFIASLFNLKATPDFIVWRTDIPTQDIKKAVVWTEYIGRSPGEQGAFTLMISNGILDAAQINVRQGIADIFSGPSGAGSRGALLQIAKRPALRVEKLLATGTGTDAVPATMGFEGFIAYRDVETARLS